MSMLIKVSTAFPYTVALGLPHIMLMPWPAVGLTKVCR